MEMSVLDTFEKWKTFLAKRVEQAKMTGMSEQAIAALAYQVGEYLAAEIDPKNGEERLLQQLWACGTDEEQKVLARLMVKLVERT
jgi:hypothetical protein